jgi:hypothetical protein
MIITTLTESERFLFRTSIPDWKESEQLFQSTVWFPAGRIRYHRCRAYPQYYLIMADMGRRFCRQTGMIQKHHISKPEEFNVCGSARGPGVVLLWSIGLPRPTLIRVGAVVPLFNDQTNIKALVRPIVQSRTQAGLSNRSCLCK